MTDTLERPASNEDREGWKAYWTEQGMSWRTEPEIDDDQQQRLAEQRATVKPDVEKGIYPFKGIHLTRADIEWLLASHPSGGMQGPVDWNDPCQRSREGLDVRGAFLQDVNLEGLPLARLHGGVSRSERLHMERWQRSAAAVHMENTSLTNAHLEGATLNWALLTGSDLSKTHLEAANLNTAHVEGVNFYEAHMEGIDLGYAFFDAASYLRGAHLFSKEYDGPQLIGVHWGNADLTLIRWEEVKRLGDEQLARKARRGGLPGGGDEDAHVQLDELDRAILANRQLATALRNQGANEHADRFAYRAQVLQRTALRRKHKYFPFLGSFFLWLIAGYGYRPLWSFITYVVVVLGFAAVYFLLRGNVHPALSPLDAVIFSITSFHGRGFSPGESVRLHNPLTIFAAVEAIIGLLIEITFIATFTQRFFAR